MVKFIVFTCVLLFLSLSGNVKADSALLCLKCNSSQAEAKALFQARNDRTGIYFENKYFTFDPVTLTHRTFKVIIEYDRELKMDLEDVYLVSSKQDYIGAMSAYKSVIDGFYEQAQSMKDPNEDKAAFDYHPAPFAAKEMTVNANEYLYTLLQGNMVYEVPFPSYDWAKQDANWLEVDAKLQLMFKLNLTTQLITAGLKQAFSELILQMPLQYTIKFQNDDTLTAFMDCFICSIVFLPLHETAKDKLGNRLGGTNKTQGSHENNSSYGDFYHNMDTRNMGLRKVCTVAHTYSGGGWFSQEVCWLVWM